MRGHPPSQGQEVKAEADDTAAESSEKKCGKMPAKPDDYDVSSPVPKKCKKDPRSATKLSDGGMKNGSSPHDLDGCGAGLAAVSAGVLAPAETSPDSRVRNHIQHEMRAVKGYMRKH